jgi:hypothetical protein
MTPEENEILQRLSAKAQRAVPSSVPKEKDEILQTDIYAANMALLQR